MRSRSTRPAPRRVNLLLYVLEAAGVVAMMAWSSHIVDGGPVPIDVTLGPLAGYLLGRIVGVAVHELGHVAAALAVRLPVRGLAIGRLRWGASRSIPGTAGHVLVDQPPTTRALPLRLILGHAGGPAATLAVAALAAGPAADPSVPVSVRVVIAGFVVANLMDGARNLVPMTLGAGVLSDGRQILRWIRPQVHGAARLTLQRDAAQVRDAARDAGAASDPVEREVLLAPVRGAVVDPRLELAQYAMPLLLTSLRPPELSQADADALVGFAARTDAPLHVRTEMGEAMSRAVFLVTVAGGFSAVQTHPHAATVVRLAEATYAARPDWAPSRVALGLARIAAGRPDEARAVVVEDARAAAEPGQRAAALAVGGFAAAVAGNHAEAVRLARASRTVTPDDSLTNALWHLLGLAAPAAEGVADHAG